MNVAMVIGIIFLRWFIYSSMFANYFNELTKINKIIFFFSSPSAPRLNIKRGRSKPASRLLESFNKI